MVGVTTPCEGGRLGRPTARDPAAAANTATPPATATPTATGGVGNNANKRVLSTRLAPASRAHNAGRGPRNPAWRCCMNTRCGWGGVARTSRDPPQEPHYGDEVEGSSQV